MIASTGSRLDPVIDCHVPHSTHMNDRIWPETNCYLDLCIELIHVLGHDPIPMLACVLSADHDGEQWTFVKPDPSDLRVLYGIDVAEANLWRPVLESVESGFTRGALHTVEVDSWWLPDTAGTDYRSAHVKTTIVPLAVDRDSMTMTYVHNGGVHRLADTDFGGVFSLTSAPDQSLPPYVELVRTTPTRNSMSPVEVTRRHLDRRPALNPVRRLGQSVISAVEWLPDEDMSVFHRWAFSTLRQCGASAELASDLCLYLDDCGAPGAATASPDFHACAQVAKSVQFKMARAARGRTVDVEDMVVAMAKHWEMGMSALDMSVPRAPAYSL